MVYGLVEVPDGVDFGPLRFLDRGDDGSRAFEFELDVQDLTDIEREGRLTRLQGAIEACLAAASSAYARVFIEHVAYPKAGMPHNRTRIASADLIVRASIDDAQAGVDALYAVLDGSDARLIEMYELYILGVQASQSIAPVVGFWAFSNVLEEISEGSNSLNKVPRILRDLRGKGFDIPPDPIRKLDTIRAAAVHPTPELPMPTRQEIEWFQTVAQVLLRWRVAHS